MKKGQKKRVWTKEQKLEKLRKKLELINEIINVLN